MDPPIETTADLWDRFHACLRSFIRKRVNDDADAEEILQSVFVRIHAHLSTVRNTERLQAWVYRIARNAIADHYSARNRAGAQPAMSPEAAADQAAGGETDASRTARADLSRCMMLLLEELPEPFGEAVMLAELGALSQQELAERLGLSYSGLKSRVQRGRDQLRGLLLRCCEIERDARGGIIDFTPRDADARRKCDCHGPPGDTEDGTR